MKSFIIVFLFFTLSLFAQIDTSIWYPMSTGNYWEYQDSALTVRTGIDVIGDTLMNNGKTYKIFRIKDLINNQLRYNSYRRLDSVLYVYLYNANTEYKFYDFSKNVSDSWRIDSAYDRRVVKKDSSWIQLFQKNLPRMEFEDLYATIKDTIYFERSWQQIYKGIGDVILGESGGYVELVGAIINGQRYGTITSVLNETKIPWTFNLRQNYPNPFNPSTVISYSLTTASIVKLIVYNTIGKKIKILVNGFKNAGSYSVDFNASDLPSGIYFYKLEAGQFSQIKKMMVIK